MKLNKNKLKTLLFFIDITCAIVLICSLVIAILTLYRIALILLIIGEMLFIIFFFLDKKING